jgi:very-short-patch-repair endonuclease
MRVRACTDASPLWGVCSEPSPLWGEGRVRGEYARRLRKQQTDTERKLWARLRDRRLGGVKFRRQHPIGPYIVDFCCPEAKLVIELDGGQHTTQRNGDERRSLFIEAQGYGVLRFWDNEVLLNIEGVLERIGEALADPHPGPLPEREREKDRPPRGRGKGEGR